MDGDTSSGLVVRLVFRWFRRFRRERVLRDPAAAFWTNTSTSRDTDDDDRGEFERSRLDVIRGPTIVVFTISGLRRFCGVQLGPTVFLGLVT